jgi:beta-glucosidase
METSLTPDERANLVIQQITLAEKIALVHGSEWNHNVWVNNVATSAPVEFIPGAAGYLPGIPRLGIPALQMVDAAVGVTRGSAVGRYSTLLPSCLSQASAWSIPLSREYGALIGQEIWNAGFNMSLGGGCNLARDPRNGRNFEYLGEDPILAGRLDGAVVAGLQQQGVLGDVKHYALNDQETQRTTLNAVMTERAMRETDLLAFEIAVREGHPDAVMCSYNKVNGIYACQNPYLLTDVLKKDIGFKGFVISDWEAVHSVEAAIAGTDMEMPDGNYFGDKLQHAIEDDEVSLSRLNDMVRRILRSEFRAGLFDRPQHAAVPDIDAGMRVAQKVAEEGSVLLRNDGLLPLSSAHIRHILLVGGHADVGVLSGGGSAQVDPPGQTAANLATRITPVYFPSSPLRAMRAAFPTADVQYVSGKDIAATATAAANADIVFVFGVQPNREDTDLKRISLPDSQDNVIEAVAAANPHTVVVLETGNPVTMPWIQKVSAVLEIWYPGICGAEVLAELVTGKVNPSGKLPITFPRTDADLPRPSLVQTPKGAIINYFEGLYVGYKWYDHTGKQPLFPFGFGLSYTSFAYFNLKMGANGSSMSFDLKNTGAKAGTEISQVYVTLPAAAEEPSKRLVGWARTTLLPGETKRVQIDVDPFFFATFDASKHTWRTPSGDYVFRIGGSSASLPVSTTVAVKGN